MRNANIILPLLVTVLLFFVALFLSENLHIVNKKGYDCVDCNVVLISVDTLRADHLYAYGYPRKTTPRLDEFFANSMIFSNAFSQSPWTAPSHMTLMTSTYPSIHQVENFNQKKGDTLDEKIKTVAEVLADNGYRTAAFTGGANIAGSLGFNRGFEVYGESGLTWREVNGIGKWIDENRDNKFFLFLHTYLPHDPYVPVNKFNIFVDPDYSGRLIKNEGEFLQVIGSEKNKNFDKVRRAFWTGLNKSNPRDIEHLKNLYDGEILQTDDVLSNILDKVQGDGLSEKTIVIFTSDHGEEFNEHGGFMHHKLYEEIIHIPLFIHHPKFKKQDIVENQVRSIDIAPTILDFLRIDKPKQFQGISLIELLENRSIELIVYGEGGPSNRSVRYSGWKYIQGKEQLFNLVKDPGEKKNLINKEPEVRDELKAIINDFSERNDKISQLFKTTSFQPKNLTLEQLRNLGYYE